MIGGIVKSVVGNIGGGKAGGLLDMLNPMKMLKGLLDKSPLGGLLKGLLGGGAQGAGGGAAKSPLSMLDPAGLLGGITQALQGRGM